jgi:hypothetical protein
MLIVRESASIENWASDSRVLRTMVGVEIGSKSKAALHWAADQSSVH